MKTVKKNEKDVPEKTAKKGMFPLQARISAIYAAIILLLNIFTGMVIFQYFQDTVQGSIKSSLGTAMHSNASKVEQFLQKVDVAIGLICNDDRYLRNELYSVPSILQIVNTYSAEMDTDEKLAFVRDLNINTSLFKDYLQISLGDSERDYACMLYIDQQYPVSKALGNSKRHRILTNQKGFYNSEVVQELAWYQEAKKRQGEAYWFHQEDPDRICMAKLLTYRKIGADNLMTIQNLGVIVLSFDISWIWEQVEQQQEKSSLIFLAGKDQPIFYSSGGSLEGQSLLETAENANNQEIWETTIDGVGYYGQKNELPLELTFVELRPMGNIGQETGRTVWTVYLFTLGISVIAIIFVHLTSGVLTKPIRALAAHMEQTVSEPISCENVGNDEVGKLYYSFNQMIQRVNQLIRDVRSSYGARRAAELRALQMQINPHFVYNTLDSVCCLSLMRGDDDLADILSALTQIMRYNTKKPDELVPLAVEMEFLKKYEQIQRMRYQDDLAVQYSMEEPTADLLVPKLIIQPLVENAILYGMKENGSIAIRIESFCREDLLVIRVINETHTAADIDFLNRQAGTTDPDGDQGGIGISNIAVRLRMIYGSNASLRYFEREGEAGQAREVVAELKFPILTKKIQNS